MLTKKSRAQNITTAGPSQQFRLESHKTWIIIALLYAVLHVFMFLLYFLENRQQTVFRNPSRFRKMM